MCQFHECTVPAYERYDNDDVLTLKTLKLEHVPSTPPVVKILYCLLLYSVLSYFQLLYFVIFRILNSLLR